MGCLLNKEYCFFSGGCAYCKYSSAPIPQLNAEDVERLRHDMGCDLYDMDIEQYKNFSPDIRRKLRKLGVKNSHYWSSLTSYEQEELLSKIGNTE